MHHDLQPDLAAIAAIDAIPTILDLACRVTGMGFAAVARVTEDRWVAGAVLDGLGLGLRPGGEIPIDATLCKDVRRSRHPVIIDDVATDPTYCGHRTLTAFRIRSYISVPIVCRDGTFFGTLCAMSHERARPSDPTVVDLFGLFAELIACHLDARERLEVSEASLLCERESARLREQFIAVLSHDLRSPLASIDAGAQILLRLRLEESARSAVGLIQRSVGRMTALIDNVLDFAAGRLGGGLAVEPDTDAPLTPVLEQVVSELRAVHPDRRFETAFAVAEPVRCDRLRIGQLLSNLLSNAVSHGTDEGAIRVEAETADGTLTLSVVNDGGPLPAETTERLFQPFFRAQSVPGRKGLGLGLYIAGEIARAHGGTLTASSGAGETRFTLRMPIG